MNIIGNLKVRFITRTENVIGKLHTFLDDIKKTIVHYSHLDEYYKYYECEFYDDVSDNENNNDNELNENKEDELKEDDNELKEDDEDNELKKNEDDE